EQEIENHLSTADIVLLLVSATFLASDYCYSKEMKWALQRHNQGTARVVPIILRPVYWRNAPFSELQVLPTGAKPITSWINPDEACEDIARSLHGVVEELQDLREPKQCFQRGVALVHSKRYEEALVVLDQAI